MRPFVSVGALAVLIVVVASAVAAAAVPVQGILEKSSSAGGGGCPSSNAIGNFNASSQVGASVIVSNSSWTYLFSSFVNLNSTSGIPGLIEYCVYPSGSLPSSITASAIGADGSSFTTVSKSAQGYFGFDRSTGDPSNVPLNGALDTVMGSASWGSSAPTNQTILLHINDAAECAKLYGGSSTTCFVTPGTPPPSGPCLNQPVCKNVTIAEATSTSPLTVPRNTTLHIQYNYTIVNQASNTFNMEFLVPAPGGQTTGVKDYFTCEQTVDPAGSPSAYGFYSNYQSTGLGLRITDSANPTCDRPSFTLSSHSGAVTLSPGQSITFTIDMVSRAHGFTGLGTYCINAGVTVVWYQSNDGLYHSYHSPMVDVTVA